MTASPLVTIVASFFSAVIGTLLTIFLTPVLQHHLWRRQRRAEIKLAAIKEFNRLVTEFIAATTLNRDVVDHVAWFQQLNTVNGDIEVLFSSGSVRAVEAVNNMIVRGPGRVTLGGKTPDEFIAARDAALRTLYSEVIPFRR